MPLRRAHRPSRIGLLVLVLGVLVPGLVGPPALADTVVRPVLNHDFADPDVLEVDGTYFVYSTNAGNRHIWLATSQDLMRWKVADRDPLPHIGDWADPRWRFRPEAGDFGIWAPEVFDNGHGYTMLYTAHDRATDKQCIGAARARTPWGPFTPAGSRPVVCPAELGGAIDPATFVEGGHRYLLWKNDGNCCGKDTWLYLQRVTWDGTRVLGRPIPLIRQDRDWEGPVVEAPTLVKRGGRYVLFYSANYFSGTGYKVGYAVADNLTGPYRKASKPLLTSDSLRGAVRGPGGQDVVVGPDGRDHIVFHGWDPEFRYRMMYRADLGWANGSTPIVRGSTTRYEAEDAFRVHAPVRVARDASAGRAVGPMEHPDSAVQFAVFAASSGPHIMTVWFGHSSRDGSGPAAASHALEVNHVRVGQVEYPYTGRETWQSAEVGIELREGWNVVRLGKARGTVRLDAVDIA
ncbi:family 43 glycosylhydrolase [Longimycelium tulufanense]|nr:family 43 glycosylhydrolase [Longimycelium tulufanense]